MPSAKYVAASEIFAHAQRIATTFGLYDKALLAPLKRPKPEYRFKTSPLHELVAWLGARVGFAEQRTLAELPERVSHGQLSRDGERVAPLFDERDPAVLAAVRSIVEECRRLGLTSSICGQAPSDHPEFAAFLEKRAPNFRGA